MLLQTYQPSLCGSIPPKLFDQYVRYKQDTRAVLSWLSANGGSNSRNPSLTIDGITKLSHRVQERGVIMPQIIAYQFREAISARTHFSNFFRSKQRESGLDKSTVDHEHFTSSLQKIYNDLSVCSEEHHRAGTRRLNRSTFGSPKFERENANRYDTFQYEGSSADLVDEILIDKKSEEDVKPNTVDSVRECGCPQIIDDSLVESFEIQAEVQEMEGLRNALDSIWEPTSRGETPLSLAAFLTNLVFVEFDSIAQRLHDTCKCSNPDELKQKFCASQGHAEGSTVSLLDQVSKGQTALVDALCLSWPLLLEARDLFQSGGSPVFSGEITLSRETADSSIDKECLATFIANFFVQVKSSSIPNPSRHSNPLSNQIRKLVTGDCEPEARNIFQCVYGLQMLLSTSKAYLITEEPPSPFSVRLSSLRFAQEALSDITAVLDDASFPCRCCGTLAAELFNTQRTFQAFVSTRVFDPVTLCPWTSASHQLHMHTILFGHGMRLLSYRHHVASIVHVYHVLRRSSNLAPVPLLENMRNNFASVFFPGGLPERNFRSCCIRYMGGRLAFDGKGHKHHRNGSHDIRVPATSARVSAGFCTSGETDARLDVAKVSMMHYMDKQGMRIDDLTWEMLMNRIAGNGSKKGRPRRSSGNDMQPQPSSARLSKLLPNLHKALLEADFSAEFPRARLNFLAIYLACVRVARRISLRTHVLSEMKKKSVQKGSFCAEMRRVELERKNEDHEKINDSGPAQICLCFMDTVLSAADEATDMIAGANRKERRERKKAIDKVRVKEDLRKGSKREDQDVEFQGGFGKDCRDVLGVCVQAIQEEFEGKGIENFLWQSS